METINEVINECDMLKNVKIDVDTQKKIDKKNIEQKQVEESDNELTRELFSNDIEIKNKIKQNKTK
jgi:hypothetical protein